MDEIRKDPQATFEIEAALPSGNKIHGTVGPVINGRLLAHIEFAKNPASEDDVKVARALMDKMMDRPASVVLQSDTSAEYAVNLQKARGFLGGGEG